MIEVVPFEEEHLEKVQPRAVYAPDVTLKPRVKAAAALPNGMVFTIKEGDDIYAILGGNVLFPGVAEVWAVTSDLVTKTPKSFIKACRKLLDACAVKFNIIRYHMFISAELGCGHRFARSLGFSLEGRMRKFYPGGVDALIYGRV